MEIIPAQLYQLEEIFAVFKKCKRVLDDAGIFQWTDAYPVIDTIEQDIENNEMYCLMEEGHCVGVVALSENQDAAYATVRWQYNEGRILVVHRLAIDPVYQGKGYARKLMEFAETLARENGYESVRLDAYSKNPRSWQLYEQRGYLKSGEVYFPGREFIFYCYEKPIDHSQ